MFAPGQHTLTTRTNDANGNPIASSAPIPVTVAGGPVAQKSATPAGAKPGTQTPTFTDLPQGTQWPSGMPVMLSGTAPPGSKVQVFANDKLGGETVAGPDGKWKPSLAGAAARQLLLDDTRIRPRWRTSGRICAYKGDGCRPGYADSRCAACCHGRCSGDSNRFGYIGSRHDSEGNCDGFTCSDCDARSDDYTHWAGRHGAGSAAGLHGLTEGALLPPGAPSGAHATPGTKIQLFDGDKQIAESDDWAGRQVEPGAASAGHRCALADRPRRGR